MDHRILRLATIKPSHEELERMHPATQLVFRSLSDQLEHDLFGCDHCGGGLDGEDYGLLDDEGGE